MNRTRIALVFIALFCFYNLTSEFIRRSREEDATPRHIFRPDAYTTGEDENHPAFDSSMYFENLHSSLGSFLQGVESGLEDLTGQPDAQIDAHSGPNSANTLRPPPGYTHEEPLAKNVPEKAGRGGLRQKNKPKDVGSDSTAWCKEAMWKNDVRPGASWGRLTVKEQAEWGRKQCDQLVTEKAMFVRSEALPDCSAGSGDVSRQEVVAVCCGTTTRKVTGPQISKLALFRYLLPSIAHTVDCGLRYMVVVGYDKGDPFYDTYHGLTQVENWFEQHMQVPLAQRGVNISLRLVKVVNTLKKPGPVFNTITKYAYDEGADYIYRVNDDTEMASPWAKKFISQLQGLGAPYGAVGPLCQQGNTKILTHDFTHRTHMEIFGGEYYPKELVDWWMDDWISRVYGSKRTRQGKSVPVVHHTGAHGQRYQVNKANKQHLERLIKEGKEKILAYARRLNVDGKQLAEISNDRFTGHPFKQF